MLELNAVTRKLSAQIPMEYAKPAVLMMYGDDSANQYIKEIVETNKLIECMSIFILF